MSNKIALIIPGFQSSLDDWCIPVFTNLARELSRHLELHVYALRYPARHDSYSINGTSIHSLGAGAIAGKRVAGISILKLWHDCLAAVEHEHRSAPFRAIMGIWATEAGWLATRAASRLGLPSLVHLAGGELTYIPQIRYGNYRRGLAGRLVDSTLSHADMITAPSPTMRSRLERLDGMDLHKVRDWAPGVDIGMFSPADENHWDNQPFVFVSAGWLIPVKGHELLLRSLAIVRTQVPERDVRLRVIGEGPLRPMLASLVSDLGLAGYVSFEGEVAHDVLPQTYRQSDAFLLGSWHEAQCMAVLEAMSCGLPWVGPPIGSLRDIHARAKGRPSGITFNERDPMRVARAMRELVELSPGESADYGRRARSLVVEDYALETQSRKLIQLLEGLTERRRVAYDGGALP